MTQPTPPSSDVSAGKVRRDRTTALVLIVIFIVTPVLALLVAPTTLKAYDNAHQMHVTCSVYSAHSSSDSSRSTKGFGSSSAQVVYESKGCGTLVQRWGVSAGNQEQLAARVEAGARYRFTVGEGSYKLRSLLAVVRQAVFVKSPMKVSG